MYLGRFLIIAPDFGVYRVSSRSFPDRVVRENDDGLAVVPEDDYDNPYVSYNCLRKTGDLAVIGNGTHVDPLTEKIELGYPARDALALSLLAMDFEKDEYDTPRIAGVTGEESYVGIVSRDSLIIESVDEPTLVSTYENQIPEPIDFTPGNAEDAAKMAYELDYEHPVASCGWMDDEVGIYNG
ncbi:MAG: IMP cyclohydrolase [Halobacteria archaeon]